MASFVTILWEVAIVEAPLFVYVSWPKRDFDFIITKQETLLQLYMKIMIAKDVKLLFADAVILSVRIVKKLSIQNKVKNFMLSSISLD